MPDVQLIGITKRFGNVTANDSVSIDIRANEIHSLLGENGAGKTTLMNILYGLYKPDSGHIVIDGAQVSIGSPQQAIAHGIGMVHQHFMLVPSLTIAENYAIGQTSIVKALSIRDFERRVIDDSERTGLPLNPRTLVADLSVGQQQRVEIVRALGRGAKLLILDEPTAVLTPQESNELMKAFREMAARGTSVVFISHKLEEVMEISNRISILRNGQHIRTVTPSETNKHELALMMIGRDELKIAKRSKAARGKVVLTVRGLNVHDDRGHQAIKDLSLDLHQNEILGIAGVDGNGQTELSQALVGLRVPSAGSVRLDNKELAGRSPAEIIQAEVAFISEDRQTWGLFPELTIAENLIADRHSSYPFGQRGFLHRTAIGNAAKNIVRSFDIRPPDTGTSRRCSFWRQQAKSRNWACICQATARPHHEPADPRRRYRRDRIHSPARARRARTGRRNLADLGGPRRDYGAQRPDCGFVRGTLYGYPAGRTGDRRKTRPTDGRRPSK